MKLRHATVALLVAAGWCVYLFSFFPDSPEVKDSQSSPRGTRSRVGGTVKAEQQVGRVAPEDITAGVENTVDVSKPHDGLTAEFAKKLELLTPDQRRVIFTEVTAQLNLMTQEELKLRTSDDPQKRRAMLLIPALTALLQRTDPSRILEWSVEPNLSPLWKRKIGKLAAETLGIHAKTQPKAALDWMKSHSSKFTDEDRLRAWAATLGGVAYKDLPLALEEAKYHGLRGQSLEAMVPALTTMENRKLWVEAVSSLDDSVVRKSNWSGLVREQIQAQGWELAYELLQSLLPQEAVTPENLRRISGEALTHNPAAFAGKLTLLPESTTTQAIPEFISRWTDRDYNAAAEWLRTAPPGAPWRDAAVESMVQKIAPIDPAAAQAWQATLGDSTAGEPKP